MVPVFTNWKTVKFTAKGENIQIEDMHLAECQTVKNSLNLGIKEQKRKEMTLIIRLY